MKLRIEDNSLRLRLSEAEVQQFAEAGRVAAVLPLGPAATDSLTYALERVETGAFSGIVRGRGHDREGARHPGQPLDFNRPKWVVGNLAATETQSLKVLIEKDLDCRH